MKLGFYPRLAWSGIRKNKRLFVPYILAAAGTAAVFYIMFYLASGDLLDGMRGGTAAQSTLSFGVFVIVAFALLFLFYCNSFLVRRRYKEFGLYSILGMNRKNISRVLAWETLLTALLSLIGGIFIGALLSKLAEMIFLHMLGGTADYSLHISLPAIKYMLLYFGGIFALIYISSLIKLHRSTVVELVHSESYGEKPVKANPVLGIAGVILLSAAYILAVSIKEPLQALTIFFIAVIMVIVGTYLVFISGSVLLCKILQKNKRYYYTPRHFVSVSSMTYRMKRNGAGLASICVLATMVLVMISTTVSLYFGVEDSLNTRYPNDLNLTAYPYRAEEFTDENTQKLIAALTAAVKAEGVEPETEFCYRMATVAGLLNDGRLQTRYSGGLVNYNALYQIYFLDVSDFNRLSGQNVALAPDEALVYTHRGDYEWDVLAIDDALEFRVVGRPSFKAISGQAAANISPTVYAVVSDLNAAAGKIDELLAESSDSHCRMWLMGVDLAGGDDVYVESFNIENRLALDDTFTGDDSFVRRLDCESRSENATDFYNTYGSLLFLGGILSVVFVCAAVLIIYYKQVSEGYEDQARFEIMQKVGMTKREIRRSINSQLLTVFFLPLLGALCHLCFAFPMLLKLLQLFNLNNVTLFAATTLLSFLAFALMYALVYKLTSGAYCAIVSGAKKE